MDDKQIDMKINNIKRGAYWFGIVGRLSIFMGSMSLLLSLFSIIHSYPTFDIGENGVRLLGGAISYLIYGWLFLLGRDTFEAIVFTIIEIKQTV